MWIISKDSQLRTTYLTFKSVFCSCRIKKSFEILCVLRVRFYSMLVSSFVVLFSVLLRNVCSDMLIKSNEIYLIRKPVTSLSLYYRCIYIYMLYFRCIHMYIQFVCKNSSVQQRRLQPLNLHNARFEHYGILQKANNFTHNSYIECKPCCEHFLFLNAFLNFYWIGIVCELTYILFANRIQMLQTLITEKSILVSADEASELFVDEIEWNEWSLFLFVFVFVPLQRNRIVCCNMWNIRNSIGSRGFDMLSKCNHKMR